MKWTHTRVATALAAAALSSVALAQQPFPNRPLRLIIGFTPGSEVDVIGRMVAHEMSEHWGQKVVVDNRSGAGGSVAAGIVAGATADGYTLFFTSVSHAATPGLYPKAPFDSVRDFAGVSQATSLPNVLTVSPSIGVRSIKDLVAQVKAKAGQINYGSAGVGSGTHITGEMFKLGAGLNVSHIPYKGVPEVLTDTVTARVHYSFAPIGNTLPFIKDKRLVPLAVTLKTRSAQLPEVPTVDESVVPGFEWDQWYGLLAPAKTPRPVVNQLSKEIARIMSLPEVKDRLASRGAIPNPSSPEAFDRFLRAEVDKITKVIKTGGVRID
jgi:tripartite-type tricarboxylate transporter receptor subunit TctC